MNGFVLIFGITTLILIIGGPVVLMIWLLYSGEKSRREELKKNRFFRRGFEVKLNTGEEPVIKKERDNDHG